MSGFEMPEKAAQTFEREVGEPAKLGAWSEAFVKAQAAIPTIEKDSEAEITTKSGAKYSYTYLTLDKMLEHVKPALNANGLAILQPLVLSPEGKPRIRTIIVHTSGEERSWEMPVLVAGNATPQEFGSALTYAKRYHLSGILGVAIEEDSDGAQLAAPAPTGSDPQGEPAAAPPVASQEQHAKLHAELNDLETLSPTPEGQPSWDDETKRWTLEVKGKDSRSKLTKAEMSELIAMVQDWKLPFLTEPEQEPGAEHEHGG